MKTSLTSLNFFEMSVLKRYTSVLLLHLGISGSWWPLSSVLCFSKPEFEIHQKNIHFFIFETLYQIFCSWTMNHFFINRFNYFNHLFITALSLNIFCPELLMGQAWLLLLRVSSDDSQCYRSLPWSMCSVHISCLKQVVWDLFLPSSELTVSKNSAFQK